VGHIFIVDHQPAFAVGDLCGSAVHQGAWMHAIASPKVRAVFSGHVHAYEHLERAGVRYFVTGGAGAPLDRRLDDCDSYNERALVVYRPVPHYLRVRVQGLLVVLDAISTNGSLIDNVRLDVPPADRSTSAGIVPYSDELAHPRQSQAATVSPRVTNWLLSLWLLLLGFAGIWLRRRRRLSASAGLPESDPSPSSRSESQKV
jgi:hypothetical protein